MNASREIIEHSRRSPLFPSVGDRLRWRAVAEMFQSGKRREQIYSMRVAAVEPRVRLESLDPDREGNRGMILTHAGYRRLLDDLYGSSA
jgi:hypothetical protein